MARACSPATGRVRHFLRIQSAVVHMGQGERPAFDVTTSRRPKAAGRTGRRGSSLSTSKPSGCLPAHPARLTRAQGPARPRPRRHQDCGSNWKTRSSWAHRQAFAMRAAHATASSCKGSSSHRALSLGDGEQLLQAGTVSRHPCQEAALRDRTVVQSGDLQLDARQRRPSWDGSIVSSPQPDWRPSWDPMSALFAASRGTRAGSLAKGAFKLKDIRALRVRGYDPIRLFLREEEQ